MITTIEEARAALNAAELDVIGDFGKEMLEAGYNDIVRSIAAECDAATASELLRINGVWSA